MFKKNNITICAGKPYEIEDIAVIISNIKIYKLMNFYHYNDKLYVIFTTRLSVSKLAKMIEETLYKTKATIHGNEILLEMKP